MSTTYEEWLAKAKADGLRLSRYQCPSCGVDIETPTPACKRESYDSMMLCPHCGELHFKIAHANGTLEVREARSWTE